MASFPPPSPALLWMEIGRASPDDASLWTMWTAPLADGGALYRTLIVSNGFASVVVELQPQRGAPMRTIHKRGGRLPEAPVEETLRAFLGAADTAASTTIARTST